MWKTEIVLLLGGELSTAAGVSMISSGATGGWLVACFFGLMSCTGLLVLLPNSAFIRVSKEGFEFRNSFRSVLFPWDEIESFNHCSLDDPRHEFVELLLSDSAPESGDRIPIPPVYGIMPMVLANLLNDWKQAIEETRIPA
jgi:hypothetical protein